MRSQGLGLRQRRSKLIWIGEAVSIGVMELVMNLVD